MKKSTIFLYFFCTQGGGGTSFEIDNVLRCVFALSHNYTRALGCVTLIYSLETRLSIYPFKMEICLFKRNRP